MLHPNKTVTMERKREKIIDEMVKSISKKKKGRGKDNFE